MESDIIKTISPNQIIEIFEKKSDIVNIRYYEPLEKQHIKPSNFDVPIKYKIRIRHNEKENAKKLMNNAINKITPP